MMSNLDLLTLEIKEKIAELADKCEVWNIDGDYDISKVDLEKFAELIIQEYVLQKREFLSNDAIDTCLSNAIINGWYPVDEDSYRQGFFDAVKFLG
jgi:hypothetical protein